MIAKLVDWMLSPLTRRVRREVDAALAKREKVDRFMRAELSARTKY